MEDEFKQERIPHRVAKIPISKTFNELAGLDFVDYGDHATCPHLQHTFPMYSIIVFIWDKNKEEQTFDKSINAILTHFGIFFWNAGYN